MGRVREFRDLVAWQRAHRLSVEAYRMTIAWPQSDLFTLGSQMRRSSGSVPDNIAEGFGQGTRPAFLKHLRIARGSLCEFESQVARAVELGHLKLFSELSELAAECQRLLQAFITSLERSTKPGPEKRRSDWSEDLGGADTH